MDRAAALAQRAGVAAGEGGLHFGNHRERDLLRRVGAQIEADGGVEPRALDGRDRGAGAGEIGKDFFRAFFCGGESRGLN